MSNKHNDKHGEKLPADKAPLPADGSEPAEFPADNSPIFDEHGNRINKGIKSEGEKIAPEGYIHVTMLKTAHGSLDGINGEEFIEGKEYDISPTLYNDFVSLEAVEPGLYKQLTEDEKLAEEKIKEEKAKKEAPLNK